VQLLFAHDDTSQAPAIRYGAEALLSDLGVDLIPVSYRELPAGSGSLPLISYGRELPAWSGRPHLHIRASGLFGEDFLRPASLPDASGHPPIPYSASGEPEARAPGRLITSLDLVASAFFMASRYEEALAPERDRVGRFSAAQSYAHRRGLLGRPLVDAWGEQVREWLQDLGWPIERPDRPFLIGLSHDIDRVSGGWAEAVYHELKHIRPAAVASVLARRLGGRDPYWSFDRILDLESRYGVRSTFYFLQRTGEARDARYDMASARFQKLFEVLRAGGWEIGLHGSYRSLERDTLAREREQLASVAGVEVIGGRQHYLRFDVRNAWPRIEAAGLGYDSSLGYADELGFRAGLARPFHPFDLERRQPCRLWEVPLVVMDTTLRTYLRLPVAEAMDRILPVLEAVRDHRGAVALLWHNTFFAGHKFAGYGEVYEQILRWAAENGGRCVPVRDLIPNR